MSRRPVPGPVYAIADVRRLGAASVPDAVEAMARGGASWVQLRAKDALPDDELFELAAECSRRLRAAGGELWINDRADIAALLPGTHLHLGQDDLPPAAARKVLGPERWIGRSTHDEAQVADAEADPEVDVVAFGPIFATSTKADAEEVVGLGGLARARAGTGKPLVAIGGIDRGTIGAVLGAGADTAAVIGALRPHRVEADCRELLAAAGAPARPRSGSGAAGEVEWDEGAGRR